MYTYMLLTHMDSCLRSQHSVQAQSMELGGEKRNGPTRDGQAAHGVAGAAQRGLREELLSSQARRSQF